MLHTEEHWNFQVISSLSGVAHSALERVNCRLQRPVVVVEDISCFIQQIENHFDTDDVFRRGRAAALSI